MDGRDGRNGTAGRRLPARGLAGLTGAIPAFAFPAPGMRVLGFVGLVPLMLVVRTASTRREAAVRAWWGGTGFFVAACYWLAPNTGPFLLILTVLLGATWTLWGISVWTALRQPPSTRTLAWALLVVPSAWVVGEFLRSWQGLGGPWALLGASQWNSRPVLALASLGGVWLLSFVLVAVGLALAAAGIPGAPARGRIVAGLAAAGIVVLAAGGAAMLGSAPPAAGTLRLGGVQPGVIHTVEPRFTASETATRRLAGTGVNLVVWGESSVGFDLADDPAHLARIEAAARAVGADILVNTDARRTGTLGTPHDPSAPHSSSGGPPGSMKGLAGGLRRTRPHGSSGPPDPSPPGNGIYKTAVLVGPDGPHSRYDKMRLVPFGEYIPLRPVFGWLTSVTEAATENRRTGDRLTVMQTAGVRFGTLICFESAFPDLGRRLARMGAEMIVVQSATSTFQGSWAPDQHASLAALRAVESGRPVVHATLTGVSAVFDASGRELLRLDTHERGPYRTDVPLTTRQTLYDRFGNWVPTGSLIALSAAGITAGLRAIRRSRRLNVAQIAGASSVKAADTRQGNGSVAERVTGAGWSISGWETWRSRCRWSASPLGARWHRRPAGRRWSDFPRCRSLRGARGRCAGVQYLAREDRRWVARANRARTRRHR
nr:apolipoprotein N-acyltransferase [Protofrankia symbiont of Coriaria ruscifolia]